jgi:AcrR family transcriptional regulator
MAGEGAGAGAAKDGRTSRLATDAPNGGGRAVAPLYKRLPHGPHRLPRQEVLRHQRLRIHGAMVEAVATNGYERTSVRQVIGLAGVSRRSFYEQFANKEECLLATFDLLARSGMRRAGRAYLATEGPLEDRLRAALGQFANAVTTKRKHAGLVLVETQTAGVPGVLRLRRATATCEEALCRSFVDAPETSPLPAPVVRGITGGVHAALSMCLREGHDWRAAELTEDILSWTMLFQTPAAERMADQIAARVARGMRGGLVKPRERQQQIGRSEDDRERIMQSTLRLAAVEDLRELTAPRIAEHAQVSMDAFFGCFADRDECFLAALGMVSEELLRVAAVPELESSDWPRAVRRAIGELMLYLADRPHYARTIAAEAFAAGPEAVQRNLELANALATLLVAGAPGEGASRLTVEAVGGAIWHTVRCQVASGRVQLLPALSDYLSYVVLAPFIGADAAVEVVTEEL